MKERVGDGKLIIIIISMTVSGINEYLSSARFVLIRPSSSAMMSGLRAVAPPGLCNRGEVRYGSIGSLEYEVPQSRPYCLCINVALCSTVLQCICRVIRRSSMTMKAHTYYIFLDVHPQGEEA